MENGMLKSETFPFKGGLLALWKETFQAHSLSKDNNIWITKKEKGVVRDTPCVPKV